MRTTSVPPAVGAEHRLLGVDQEIEHHLLDLIAVRKDLRQARGERRRDRRCW